jgi:nucleoside phosphorylase
MGKRRCQAKDYTVGWICALPIELAAAQEMLDEVDESLVQNSSDDNLYTLGRIGVHNVVVVCLPAGQTGTQSAAAVTARMRAKFPSIRFGLLVGIGGGVPNAEDIRLGDVVISQPHLQYGGVVQYDFGKTGVGGRLTRTGWLNAPPAVLLNATSQLRALHYRGQSNFATYLSAFDRLEHFGRNSAGLDVLFEASYKHVGGPTCEPCSKKREVQRSLRDQNVVIHYGTIASGNQVMRNGIVRDQISAQLGGILCFEMEAAGLMNELPCLVIRGICDYADSHKNKKWQPYASATAASCAKEILSIIPASEDGSVDEVDRQISATRESEMTETALYRDSLSSDDPLRFLALSERPEWSLGKEGKFAPIKIVCATLTSIADVYNIFEHISDYEPDRTHWNYLRIRCEGTSDWILETQEFRAWFENKGSSCIWLTGKSMCSA